MAQIFSSMMVVTGFICNGVPSDSKSCPDGTAATAVVMEILNSDSPCELHGGCGDSIKTWFRLKIGDKIVATIPVSDENKGAALALNNAFSREADLLSMIDAYTKQHLQK